MGKITNYISSLFKKKNTLANPWLGGFYGGITTTKYPFARLIFANICDIKAVIANDVTFTRVSGDTMQFAYFKRFFEREARQVFHILWQQGFAVIGYDGTRYGLLKANEYRTQSDLNGDLQFYATDPNVQIYIMESSTYAVYGMSDEQLCKPALKYIDGILNASSTIAERLGAFIVATPKSASGAAMSAVLSESEKKSLEKEITENYGANSKQSQILILPNEMNFQTMSLASLDLKTAEKLNSAVCMICDRIQVPANQVALIDTHSSKALANGSELREGDFNKYQAFERMLDATFVRMAEAFNIKVDYTIYNKPERQTQAV